MNDNMILNEPHLENTGKRVDICHYCTTKQHAIDIINWLLTEVASAGGDGNGIWYTYYFTLESIERLIKSDIDYSPWVMRNFETYITIGAEQEVLIITDDKTMFDNRPSWQQVLSYFNQNISFYMFLLFLILMMKII